MTNQLRDRLLDVRPDRIDLRDREYMPRLRSLPAAYPRQEAVQYFLPRYANMILDQGGEGACTGFGLACLINFLLWSLGWREAVLSGADFPETEDIAGVSPRMLYHLARFYDEWPGEDYEGSSCRGAMKGWHRHGVCADDLWPYRDKKGRVRFLRPKDGWQRDAATRPLGAYYRVNKNSIADLQAAIYEVGAVYVSARVHEGWFLDEADELPVIDPSHPDSGGHAFGVVGYTPDGFIVQNSWGTDWGFHGFAVMTYRDWVERGMDAWVAVLGAPVNTDVDPSSSSLRAAPLGVDAGEQRAGFWFFGGKEPYTYENEEVQPWSPSEAFKHAIVMGNNGRPLNRLIACEDARAAVQFVSTELPKAWFQKSRTPPKLVVYCHGGLNKEETSTERTRILAPYFEANGVYPIFITWKTGFLETVRHILSDAIWGPQAAALQQVGSGGLGTTIDNWRKKFPDAKDRTIEVACETGVKPIWTQMKQNASAAARAGRGLQLLTAALAQLRKEIPKLELHLVGHSAGSILIGHLLDLCAEDELPIAGCTLLAPACTVRFALDHYAPAINAKVVSSGAFHFEILSDERELEDTVGPYGKSLLYLVSRALEETHKTPLLGMECYWNGAASATEVREWSQFWKRKRGLKPRVCESSQVSDGHRQIPSAHGSFDNDVAVITRTIERIRGKSLEYPVESLRGF